MITHIKDLGWDRLEYFGHMFPNWRSNQMISGFSLFRDIQRFLPAAAHQDAAWSHTMERHVSNLGPSPTNRAYRRFASVRSTVLMNNTIGRRSRATEEKQCSLSFCRSLGETGNHIRRPTPVMSAAGAWRVWRGARSFTKIYSQ